MRRMSEVSWEMDFINLMNPLYALPIVAVVIFAILVYAFGFRSVQPPNFDEIEQVEKKVGKKRRSKESQKNKNEKGSSSLKKNVDSASSKPAKKGKNDKITADEDVGKKSAKKAKRKVLERTIPQVNEQIAPIPEEDNDDGWKICPSSKKGKKKRKQEDAIFMETTSASENSIIEQTHGIEENAAEPKSTQDVSQQSTSENEDMSLKDNMVDVKPTSNKFTKSSAKASAVIKDEEITEEPESENAICIQKGGKSTFDKSSTKPSAEKGHKKKKKSSEPLLGINEGPMESPIVEETVQENKAEKPNIEGAHDSGTEAKNGEKSNVAFDELEGLYPVAKVQKKKKSRARRDH